MYQVACASDQGKLFESTQLPCSSDVPRFVPKLADSIRAKLKTAAETRSNALCSELGNLLRIHKDYANAFDGMMVKKNKVENF